VSSAPLNQGSSVADQVNGFVRKPLLEVIEEFHVHLIYNLWFDAKLKVFKHSYKLLPIDELYGIGPPLCQER